MKMPLLLALPSCWCSPRKQSLALLLILCAWPRASTAQAQSPVTVGAWGGNYFGETTVPLAAQSGVAEIAAGGTFSLVLKTNGLVLAWGNDSSGQATVPVAAQSAVMAIAAGDSHSVALKNNGSVVAWGYNDESGQTNVPVEAQSEVMAIAAGTGHTVALKDDGSVVAWGANWAGQSDVPLEAQSGVVAISAGFGHTVVLKDNGTVVVWGYNEFGQVTGTPTTNYPYVAIASPVTLGGQVLSGVTAIKAGENHTLALKNDGSVVAWGANWAGQTNVPVAAQSGVAAIATRHHHIVALKNDRSVVAWGWNDSGQTTVPAGLSGVTAIAAGRFHTVVLLIPSIPTITAQPVSETANVGQSATFSVAATGFPLYYQWRKDGVDLAGETNATYSLPFVQTNQAGNYTVVVGNTAGSVTSAPPAMLTVTRLLPMITAQPESRTINEWQSASLTVTATGNPLSYQWRKDGVDLAGKTNVIYSLSFVQTNQTGSYAVVVSNPAGSVTSAPPAVLTVNPAAPGTVVAWGDNSYGQTSVPAAAQGGVAAIAAGKNHIVALKTDGSVVAWGAYGIGQTNVPVAAQSRVKGIAAGDYHTVTLKDDGSVVAWGWNGAGQVTGTPTMSFPSYAIASPVTLGGQVLSGVTAIAAGGNHTVALKTDGSVVAWGENYYNLTNVPSTAQSGVTAIAMGEHHIAALKTDGSVVAWGWNLSGQVAGTPTTSAPSYAIASPVILGGQVLTGVVAIAAGTGHTMAVKNDGTVVAWGFNAQGQVTGTQQPVFPYDSVASPVTIAGQVLTGVVSMAAGGYHTVALKNDGSVVAWGWNDAGQLTGTPSTYPDYLVIANPVTLGGQILRGVSAIAAGSKDRADVRPVGHTLALLGAVPLLPFLNARPSNDELVLSWPTNAVGFTLQSTRNLTPPVAWIDATNPPVVIGPQFTSTNTMTGSAQFYRLIKR